MLLGMPEQIAFRVSLDDAYKAEEVADTVLDLIERVFRPSRHQAADKRDTVGGSLTGTVTDRGGVATELGDIQVEGKTSLTAGVGAAEVEIALGRVASIKIESSSSGPNMEVTTRDGERVRVEIDVDRVLSGTSSLGMFRIALRNVSAVAFEAADTLPHPPPR